jgi:hypothetical protein
MTHAARTNGRTAAERSAVLPAHRPPPLPNPPVCGMPGTGPGRDTRIALPPAPSGLDLGWGARTESERPSSTLSRRPDTRHD